MIAYPTIPIRHTAVRPETTIPQGGGAPSITYPAVTWMTAPANVDSEYEPLSTLKYRFDPSKGRSFSKGRKAGDILMSELKIVNEKTERFLVQRNRSFKGKGFLGSYYPSDVCYYLIETSPHLHCYWTEQAHLETWSRNNPTWKFLTSSNIDHEEVKDAISSTQIAAYVNALSGYDILTELGESRETLSYLSGKLSGASELLRRIAGEDPSAWEKGKKLTPKSLLRSSDKALRRLGSRWLELRYAIMPLIYSFKDVKEILGRDGIRFKTGRSKEIITPSSQTVIFPDTCFEQAVRGEIEVRSTYKVGFDSEGLLNLLQTELTFNPFRTAYELTTLSFVVDWFLNIGDNIALLTTPNFSSKSAGCTVVKTNLIEETFLRDHSADVRITDLPATPCYPKQQFVHEFPREIREVLLRKSSKNYERFLYNRPDAKIVFQANLNWKRMIDAFALSYNPIKKTLRSLK